MYLASATRPHILCAVSKLSQFVSISGRYILASTWDGVALSEGYNELWHLFYWYPRVLEGYSDANWIYDVYERYVTRETYTSYFYELCDNQTVITIVKSSKNNIKSTRHVKRQIKSVRKLRNSRVISLDYVHTSKNLGDQFIKGLSYHVIEGVTL